MANCEISVDVKRKWWVLPSLSFLSGLYRATGYHPNLERLGDFYARNGFRYVVENKEC